MANLPFTNSLNLSDWASLQKLIHNPELAMDHLLLYKACVAASYSGLQRKEENRLGEHEHLLLAVRRKIAKADFQVALGMLEALRFGDEIPGLLRGDHVCLLANVNFLIGNRKVAEEQYQIAIEIFRAVGEEHRALRAMINLRFLDSELSDYVGGDLYALEQQAIALNFHDLVGNIKKSRAIHFLLANKIPEAKVQAELAAGHYERDGFPEDRWVALCLAAIASVILEQREQAQGYINLIPDTGGKLQSYLEIYHALVSGRKPQLSAKHPLAGMSWSHLTQKREHLDQRLIDILKKGPVGRDELIDQLWPGEVWSESHIRRLHTLVNKARTQKKIPIKYDGKRYMVS